MKLPLNRSYLNGRVRPWTMKHRLNDLISVLRRSVELAYRKLAFAVWNLVGNLRPVVAVCYSPTVQRTYHVK